MGNSKQILKQINNLKHSIAFLVLLLSCLLIVVGFWLLVSTEYSLKLTKIIIAGSLIFSGGFGWGAIVIMYAAIAGLSKAFEEFFQKK